MGSTGPVTETHTEASWGRQHLQPIEARQKREIRWDASVMSHQQALIPTAMGVRPPFEPRGGIATPPQVPRGGGAPGKASSPAMFVGDSHTCLSDSGRKEESVLAPSQSVDRPPRD